MASLTTEKIMEFQVIAESVESCLGFIAERLLNRKRICFLACLNPHSFVTAQKDLFFCKALRSSTLLLPDGIGIIAASKLLGGTIRKRITGSDIFHGVNQLLDWNRGSVFFLGSTRENLAAIRLKMEQEYPNVRIAGTYSPPFKESFSDDDNAAMIEAVNRTKPDVLWVGMTAPKQEKWAYQNLDALDVGLVGAVGAVFDFFIGTVQRSHPVFQKLGLEWLPRLLRQPGRLWKRNLISSPLFMLYMIRTYASRSRM